MLYFRVSTKIMGLLGTNLEPEMCKSDPTYSSFGIFLVQIFGSRCVSWVPLIPLIVHLGIFSLNFGVQNLNYKFPNEL